MYNTFTSLIYFFCRYQQSAGWKIAAAILALVFGGCGDDSRPADRLLVAWTGPSGTGFLNAMSTSSPWAFDGVAMNIPANAVLRCFAGDLYVVGRNDGTVSRVDIDTRQAQIIAAVGGGEPLDVAVSDAGRAYVTRRNATHLLRVDISSGATTEVLNLSAFADDDGIPDLGMMAIHDGRLFIQVLRANENSPAGFKPPAYIAVMDLATEQLVDTDSQLPGIQLVELLGTAPKLKMQVVAASNELFVSASGVFHDQGGIEVIDLATLRSKGLVISEAFDSVGADVGAVIMVDRKEGYLVSSTDFELSSHLQRFTIDDGIDPPPDLAQSIGYAAPSLELSRRKRQLFFPSGQHGKMGIFVIDVASGDVLTPLPTATNGPPSDLVLACKSAN